MRSRYQHSDHLESSHLETDGSGAVISHEEYHPFGTTAYQATLTSLGPAAKRYRFCGKERDEESGLYFLPRTIQCVANFTVRNLEDGFGLGIYNSKKAII